MNLTNLPDDILHIIINDMIINIFPVSIVNKKLYLLSRKRMADEKARYQRKRSFFDRCSTGNFYANAFKSVTTLEECDYIFEKYSAQYGPETFISRVIYFYENSYQVPTEIWFSYLERHRALVRHIKTA